MTDRYYTVPLGKSTPDTVSNSGSSTPAAPFEFRVTTSAAGVGKHQACLALDALKHAITRGVWPPA